MGSAPEVETCMTSTHNTPTRCEFLRAAVGHTSRQSQYRQSSPVSSTEVSNRRRTPWTAHPKTHQALPHLVQARDRAESAGRKW